MAAKFVISDWILSSYLLILPGTHLIVVSYFIMSLHNFEYGRLKAADEYVLGTLVHSDLCFELNKIHHAFSISWKKRHKPAS